jgi:small-conductance mechanosensitive channel
MSDFWQRAAVAGGMIAAGAVAKIVDWRISRRSLQPETATRYDVLRRSVMAAIVFVGVLSALLVIPQIRAVAGGVLASSAIVGLVIGFASQRTIGNVVAGILIAVSQPLRLGDDVEVQGVRGIVEEVGLTYTWVRTRSGDRLIVPNEKLASDTIRNSTIRNTEMRVEASVDVPTVHLRRAVAALGAEGDEAYVSALAGDRATVVVRRWVAGQGEAERAASDLRIALAERLAAVEA